MSVMSMRMLEELSNDKSFYRSSSAVSTIESKAFSSKHSFRIKIGLREEEVLLDSENSKSF